MVIKSAKFKTSVAEKSKFLKDLPEFVFAGRSNVGKSSLINLLTNRKNLAISSSTPGRTKLINYFLINDSFYFVDLPGYGYTKSGKSTKKEFSNLINEYFLTSENIKTVFILIDIRLGATDADKMLIDFCYGKFPFNIICTKADKLAVSKANQKRIAIANSLGLTKENVSMVSTLRKDETLKVLEKISACLK